MPKTSNDIKFKNHYYPVKNKTFHYLNSRISGSAITTYQDSETQLKLGICYYKNNDINKSIKYLNLALKADQDNFVALYWLALIQYKKLKNYKNAIKNFRNVLRFRNSSDVIKYFYTKNPDSIFEKATNYIVYIVFNKLLIN